MIVTDLRVANMRAIEAAEFRFQPGFNLLVGVNGAGKSTVLDALATCLSAVVRQANRLRPPPRALDRDDVRFGTNALHIDCGVQIGGAEYRYLIHRPREASAEQAADDGRPRQQAVATPVLTEFLGDVPDVASDTTPGGRPLALLFGARRSLVTVREAAANRAGAFGDALADRSLDLSAFAEWMRVQAALGGTASYDVPVLASLAIAVERFLPQYRNLRVVDDDGRRTLVLDRGETTVAVRQLSEGERGALALVLDLTRRLAQANPTMPDPAANAEAVVLIDEIELHLHPAWQRRIIENLSSAFPRCQFIATTHSPQSIGQVTHDRIQILAAGTVHSPTHSYGLDSSRVLEEIMDTAPRSHDVGALLDEVSRSIGDQRFGDATASLERLATLVGEEDPEVTRIRTLLDFLSGEE